MIESYYPITINNQDCEKHSEFYYSFFHSKRHKYYGEVKIYIVEAYPPFEKKLLCTIPHCTYKNILKINYFMNLHPIKDAEHCEKNCIWIKADGNSINVEDMTTPHIINTLKALHDPNNNIIPLGWCGNKFAWIEIFKNVLKERTKLKKTKN